MTHYQDPHHCHCFIIHNNYFYDFREKLESIGFKEPLFQENHDQVYGLTKRLAEDLQIHVKVIKNGTIEAEMEYPPDYPFAYLNPEHSYSAHDEIQIILSHFRMAYTFKTEPPITCVMRQIKKAINPTPAKVIIGGVLLAAAIGGLAYYLSRDEEK